jgi:two-component system chemotaxis response regulator CheY
MSVNRNMRILVVDDAQTMRRIVVNLLQQLGFTNTTEAEDGARAWEHLSHERVDMVISDLTMPQMDGMELLRRVRGSQAYKEVPFIMVTAEGRRERVVEAVKAGASNYIVKPFNAATLREKLGHVIGEF